MEFWYIKGSHHVFACQEHEIKLFAMDVIAFLHLLTLGLLRPWHPSKAYFISTISEHAFPQKFPLPPEHFTRRQNAYVLATPIHYAALA